MEKIYQVNTNSTAIKENIIKGKNYRITMLTDGLIRMEYNKYGVFEDRKTQVVFHRDFEQTDYQILRTENGIEIKTKRLHIYYNEEAFSDYGLRIDVYGDLPKKETWCYTKEIRDLKGTARTLDEVNGSVPLESGIVSRYGYTLLDDSCSLVLLEDGWIEPREDGIKDIYFFGYGHDYKGCLKDFYKLCGKAPMLPRFALGNWWSRYYKYTEDSYMNLMDQFEKNKLPFTVAVIDMDWHLVDIDPKYGSGWTGYTWNEDFFPNPKRFLEGLKKRGMHTTLNVHPADGVRGFEKPYIEIAKAMEVDYKKEETVLFDPSNPKFMEEYFRHLHHPLENQGVDFWWVDWQQGNSSKLAGLDPLWVLNHFHFLDSKKDGKRPLTFSRYAGPGSHRYPIGFSGDSITTWESLEFQPYFTANATNIGYSWWSHDIGGHMNGYQDNELMARWTWFGIFSPIMRLHCSNNIFNGKEPWRFGLETEAVMGEALRLRHRMIPYLYTMNHRNYEKDLPLVIPMYYEHPEDERAYQVPNQYYFGSELLVIPITTKRIKGVHVAKVNAFLPAGIWYDIFTGCLYHGDRMISLYRDIKSIPVLAKAGSILPMTDEIYGTDAIKNPDMLHLYVYGGADGNFTLYEDDNETSEYETSDRGNCCVETHMAYVDKEKFQIYPAVGNEELIPIKREYIIEFIGYNKGVTPQVSIDGEIVSENTTWNYDDKKRVLTVIIKEVCVNKLLEIEFLEGELWSENNTIERVFDFLNQAEIEFDLKDEIYQLVCSIKDKSILLSNLLALQLDYELLGILTELIVD